MKTMISILALILTLLVVTEGARAQLVTKTFTTKTFATATSRTDTSALIKSYEYPFIEVGTWTAGTDSMTIYTYVDAKYGNVWITTLRDTIKFGDATTTTGKARGFTVRQAGVSNYLPGATEFRLRNVLRPFASADSVSATSYTQYVVLRKSGSP